MHIGDTASNYISSVMADLDGVLLPGSDSDVDPLRYGAEPHPRLGSVHPVKDETDLLVLEEIEKRNLPLLAICFGMQVLNVSRGGTLIQDIPSAWPNAISHQQGAPRDRPSHAVKIGKQGRLPSVAEAEQVIVNSHHHQAVDQVGSDLIATAWASDGLIEAVEDPRPERFVLGVQWHPELGWKADPLSQALFARFITAAQAQVDAKRDEAFEATTADLLEEAATNVIWTREKSAVNLDN